MADRASRIDGSGARTAGGRESTDSVGSAVDEEGPKDAVRRSETRREIFEYGSRCQSGIPAWGKVVGSSFQYASLAVARLGGVGFGGSPPSPPDTSTPRTAPRRPSTYVWVGHLPERSQQSRPAVRVAVTPIRLYDGEQKRLEEAERRIVLYQDPTMRDEL